MRWATRPVWPAGQNGRRGPRPCGWSIRLGRRRGRGPAARPGPPPTAQTGRRRDASSAVPPAARPAAPSTSATMTRPVDGPSSSLFEAAAGADAGVRGVHVGRSVLGLRGRQRDLRRRLVRVRRADPADDLSAGVGLQGLERELGPGLLVGQSDRQPEVLELTRLDRAGLAVPGPGDPGDLLGDGAVVGLDRRRQLGLLRRPPSSPAPARRRRGRSRPASGSAPWSCPWPPPRWAPGRPGGRSRPRAPRRAGASRGPARRRAAPASARSLRRWSVVSLVFSFFANGSGGGVRRRPGRTAAGQRGGHQAAAARDQDGRTRAGGAHSGARRARSPPGQGRGPAGARRGSGRPSAAGPAAAPAPGRPRPRRRRPAPDPGASRPPAPPAARGGCARASTDRDLDLGVEGVELADARLDGEHPVAGRHQGGPADGVVPGPRLPGPQRQRADALRRERGRDGQLLRAVVLGAACGGRTGRGGSRWPRPGPGPRSSPAAPGPGSRPPRTARWSRFPGSASSRPGRRATTSTAASRATSARMARRSRTPGSPGVSPARPVRPAAVACAGGCTRPGPAGRAAART